MQHYLGARWQRNIASGADKRYPEFDPRLCHRVVFLSKRHKLPNVLFNTEEAVVRLDMPENGLTGTFNLSNNSKYFETKPNFVWYRN